MAWDDGMAQLLRDAVSGDPIVEQKMFGDLAYLPQGHMLSGVRKGGRHGSLG